MNNFISLTRIQLKDFIGRSSDSLGIKNRFFSKLILLLLASVISIPTTTLAVLMYRSLGTINQSHLMITTLYINSIFLCFFFGIPFIISVFFFSRDSRFLSTLPVKEDVLVLSKLTTVYIYLLVLSSLLMVPGLVVYLINTGVSIYLLSITILVLLMVPLLPLFISSILILPFGNIFSSSKQRKPLILIFNIILLFAIIGFQLLFGNFIEDPSKIQEILISGGLLEIIGLRFPPSIWLTRMFMGSYRDLILFITLNLVLFLILRVLARLFFRKAILSFVQEGNSSTGEIYYKEKSLAHHLLKRNILIIIKEPIFLLNTVLSMLAPLLIVVIMLFTGEFSMALLKSPQIQPYLLLIFSGLLITPAVIGNISATAITREGQTFWETRALPISAVDNIKYRVLTTIIFNLSGSIILMLISLFILPLTFKIIVLAGVLCITITLFLSMVDILINIYRPLLNWTNPTVAVKNNLNVTYSLLLRAVIGAMLYLLYKIVPGIFYNYELFILFASIVFLGLFFIVRSYIYTHGVERFEKISL